MADLLQSNPRSSVGGQNTLAPTSGVLAPVSGLDSAQRVVLSSSASSPPPPSLTSQQQQQLHTPASLSSTTSSSLHNPHHPASSNLQPRRDVFERIRRRIEIYRKHDGSRLQRHVDHTLKQTRDREHTRQLRHKWLTTRAKRVKHANTTSSAVNGSSVANANPQTQTTPLATPLAGPQAPSLGTPVPTLTPQATPLSTPLANSLATPLTTPSALLLNSQTKMHPPQSLKSTSLQESSMAVS